MTATEKEFLRGIYRSKVKVDRSTFLTIGQICLAPFPPGRENCPAVLTLLGPSHQLEPAVNMSILFVSWTAGSTFAVHSHN